VMEIVGAAKLARAGAPVDDAALQTMGEQLRQRIDRESDVLFGSARLWDDGVVDPRDTRRILGLALALAREADARTLRGNTFGVARF
jgi:geranyl-CoA carboxylase beta subunit